MTTIQAGRLTEVSFASNGDSQIIRCCMNAQPGQHSTLTCGHYPPMKLEENGSIANPRCAKLSRAKRTIIIKDFAWEANVKITVLAKSKEDLIVINESNNFELIGRASGISGLLTIIGTATGNDIDIEEYVGDYICKNLLKNSAKSKEEESRGGV